MSSEKLIPILREVWEKFRISEKAKLPPEIMDDGVVYLQLRLEPVRGPIATELWLREARRATEIILSNFPDSDVRWCSLGVAVQMETFCLQEIPF